MNTLRKCGLILVSAVVVLLFSGCASIHNKDAILAEKYLGYQTIDPIPVDKVMFYEKQCEPCQPPCPCPSPGQMKEVYWAEINDTDIRGLLPLQSAEVSVSNSDVSGKVNYLAASVSGERGSYTVVMDYMKYRVEDVVDDANEYLGSARIGVGLRIKAVVVTDKVNVDFGSLLAIGLEAKQGNLRGGISVDVIGIDSESVTNLIPLTSEIDQTSIQSALQALASIKTKIYDDKTKLTPHLVAIRQAKEQTKQKIKEKVTESLKKGINQALERKEQEKKILTAIATDCKLDQDKWHKIVDKANIFDEQRTKLKTLDSKDKIEDRLDLDAGMSGTIISALYKAL